MFLLSPSDFWRIRLRGIPCQLSRMIEISNLDFVYPRSSFRLNIENLTIAKQEKLAIIGPSGSGKTTLLNLLSGIEIPRAGKVLIDGTDVASLKDRQRRDFRIANIGFVFQQFELLDYLKVKDNILLPFFINASLAVAATDRQRKERTLALARSMEIEDKLQRRPTKLSQGEKQRVAICRALVIEPKLILADEPTGNLDPATKKKTLDLLFEQAQANGQTLVCVTHDMGILDGFDRVIDFADFQVVRHDANEVPA